MSLKNALEKVQKGLPIISTPELASAVHWKSSANLPVHRWFRYREGFSPELLNYFPDSCHRLDPFCGCGTTILESNKQGVHSYGIDLNPFATFIARTKVKRYSKTDQRQFVCLSKAALSLYHNLEPAPRPPYDLIDKLFLEESLDTLLKLRKFIELVDSKKIYNLLLLAWLSILEKSSNVFKEGNGLKYRNKRRKPGKYETICDDEWIPRYFGNSIRIFVENMWIHKCNEIAQDMENLLVSPGGKPRIRTGSCLELKNLNFDQPIDLAIFSPPYANRFDYFEAFKMELWMGGFVKSKDDMALLRSKSMRNNLAAERYKPASTWSELSPFVDEMDSSASSVRMGIKGTLQGYFDDMRILLNHLKKILIKQGKVVIVVGNSAYARSIIPTDALIARIAQEEGYYVEAIRVARHLHVSSQQRSSLKILSEYMRESVIILELI